MSLNIWLCRGVVTWFNFLMQLRKLISFLNLSHPSAYSKHCNIQSMLLYPFYELLSKAWMCWWSIGRVFEVKILILFQIFFFFFFNTVLSLSSTTSSTASSCDTEFTKEDEQRLKDYIQQLKNDRAAVKLTMLELESIHIDPLSYDVKPRGDSQRLDLENAVLMQELMAMKVFYLYPAAWLHCWHAPGLQNTLNYTCGRLWRWTLGSKGLFCWNK